MLLKHRPKGKQKAEGMVGGRKRGVVDIIKERFHWYFEIQLTERSKSTEWSKERPQIQTTRIQIGVLFFFFFWNNNRFNHTWVFTAQREIPGKYNKDLYTSDQISRSVVSDSLRPHESGFRKYSLTDTNYVFPGTWMRLELLSSWFPLIVTIYTLPSFGSNLIKPWGHLHYILSFFKILLTYKNIDLQCCACFRCTVKWISYTYTYIHSFFRFFPI